MKKIVLIVAVMIFTASLAFSAVLDEDFESGTPPTGWVSYQAGDANNGWQQTVGRAHSPTHSAYHDDDNVTNSCKDWLITPVMDLSSLTTPELTYWENVHYASYASHHDVMYSTNYSGSGDPSAATWIGINATIGTEDTWIEKGTYLLPVNSTVYVAFYYEGDYASEWYIDDVIVQDAATPVAGISIGTLSSTTTDEDGAAATFTVVLDSQPGDDVIISLNSSDISEGSVAPVSLTFTSVNWETSQDVTVTGLNDDLLDGDINYTVEIGPATSNDNNYNGIDPDDPELTNLDTDLDDDGDGISNEKEGNGDRDGDGDVNSQDYDPTGYLYDSATGEIISGGSISVTGPGNVTFVSGRNGANGFYQFVVDQVGIYTISVTPPAGYTINTGCADSGTLTADGSVNPLVLGSSENGSTGDLADYSCANNEWHLIIDIQDITPMVLNNNIPLVNNASIPTLNEWGMIITSCLLALAALTVLRRRENI